MIDSRIIVPAYKKGTSMSVSLMLALLEPGYQGDVDYVTDFNNLGPAQQRLLLDALYSALYKYINSPTMASPIGTLLARVISGDQTPDGEGRTPRYYADSLRHVLRTEMADTLKVLMNSQTPGKPYV